ncbi:zeta toxin family protein [Clostridium grantii]|uniref:UDP-N-acetylglucosamine kinase n=1 Tax=Clostridium grantii DSM 8605 TaxID=1121316 RepID=A0A1M5XTE8_9CLOT|nr:zeta toxin family protein [Clostridium grantii]SHI03077.1 Predicted ABC-type ATPase [Clostridium grantii DSM 8605]
MATYTLFAGVNGAGKTSIYKTIYYEVNKDEKRINTDEMVIKIGSWKDNNIQLKCGREAIKLINEYITNNISFNQETTLSGTSIIKNIKRAKENGFYIVVNYIGVENPDIAKKRVENRVIKGGHGIPEDTIERRYYRSLDNLKKILDICDEINIYDNTRRFKHLAYISSGKITWKRDIIPKWTESILK